MSKILETWTSNGCLRNKNLFIGPGSISSKAACDGLTAAGNEIQRLTFERDSNFEDLESVFDSPNNQIKEITFFERSNDSGNLTADDLNKISNWFGKAYNKIESLCLAYGAFKKELTEVFCRSILMKKGNGIKKIFIVIACDAVEALSNALKHEDCKVCELILTIQDGDSGKALERLNGLFKVSKLKLFVQGYFLNGVYKIDEFLKSISNVKDLQFCGISENVLGQLAMFLPLTQVESLKLASGEFELDLSLFKDAISKIKTFEITEFSSVKGGDKDFFSRATKLECLSIVVARKSKGLEEIFSLLTKEDNKLTELCLSYVDGVEEDVGMMIANAIRHPNNRLEILVLNNSAIGEKAMGEILRSLSSEHSKIGQIDLRGVCNHCDVDRVVFCIKESSRYITSCEVDSLERDDEITEAIELRKMVSIFCLMLFASQVKSSSPLKNLPVNLLRKLSTFLG